MVKCKCGKDCLCFHDVYLCPKCDMKDIQELAKAYTNKTLEVSNNGKSKTGN